MLQKTAKAFGADFLLIGILGFVPAFAPTNSDGMPVLFGLLMVGPVHNVIHLVSGLAALLSSKSEHYAALYFKVIGVVYAIVAIIGFVQKDTVLGLIHINMADNLLHLIIAASSLYFGYGLKPGAPAPAAKSE